MWKWRIQRVRPKRASSVTKHYTEHKEAARALILSRLAYFNQYYKLKWNRVAIRNQRRCWGSCSSLKNLNFNYKILLLPPHLQDYIIVHEMCHLVELNHGKHFWDLVGEQIPEYKINVAELRAIDKKGHSVGLLLKVREQYILGAPLALPVSDVQDKAQYTCESCGSDIVCACRSDVKTAS